MLVPVSVAPRRALIVGIAASFVAAAGLFACSDDPSARVEEESMAFSGSAYRIAAGATTSYTDSAGHVWLSDRRYSGGYTYSPSPPHAITGTADPALYNAERYGADANNNPAPFTYTIPVSTGDYTVNLLFSEGWVTGP